MKYIAIENVDIYKEGDEVPEEKGMVWMKMYDFPPVKVVGKEEKELIQIDKPKLKKKKILRKRF